MRIALVYNPRMSARRLGRVASLARALDRRGHQVGHHDSLGFDCRRDASEAELLCIAGGDGTVRMVVGRQGDPSLLPPIAVYPVGTINLVARELGYPASPTGFIRRIEAGHETASPLAMLGDRPFIACLSIGIDALAVASLSEGLKARIGRLAYVEAMARLLARWPRHRLTIRTDDEHFEAEAIFVLRSRFYAGPWTLHPEAHLGHGALRVLALPTARRRDVASLALRAMGGMKAPHQGWRYLETNSLQVTSADPVPIQADGDPVGALPARITMSEAVLRFR